MQSRGFHFCDGEETTTVPVRVSELGKVAKLDKLLKKAITASTTDFEEQGIENTLSDNRRFWSSTGHTNDSAEDTLVYRLKSPICAVSYVCVAVYRATYLLGDPIFPPKFVSFEVGTSESHLQKASPLYPVVPTEVPQVFELNSKGRLGNFLLVRLHGCQQRWEDGFCYLTIKQVEAFGNHLSLSQLLTLQRTCPWLPPLHGSLQAPTGKRERGTDEEDPVEELGIWDDLPRSAANLGSTCLFPTLDSIQYQSCLRTRPEPAHHHHPLHSHHGAAAANARPAAPPSTTLRQPVPDAPPSQPVPRS